MRVAIAIAHAVWPPHTGGGSTPTWTENTLSATVSALAAAQIRGLGVPVDLVEMPERWDGRVFRCVGCPGADCDQYNRGLTWVVNETRRLAGDDGLMLSFHVDRAAPGRRGPLALISHGPLARPAAEAYMTEWCALTGDTGRGVWLMPDHRAEFPSNPYFCRHYPPQGGAVLIEVGCASSALDAALFDQGNGIELVANAATAMVASLLN